LIEKGERMEETVFMKDERATRERIEETTLMLKDVRENRERIEGCNLHVGLK